jgi:dTDP-4-amino-4,6-dideoxy-D-galactose acyltransferase
MDESLEFLAWDSNFFGRSVGKIKIQTNSSVENLLNRAGEQKYELLYIYSPTAIEWPASCSFSLVDVGGQIKFSEDVSKYKPDDVQHNSKIIEFQGNGLTPELLEIAFLSGHLSRFRIDPSLPAGSFERLYETWLENSLKNRPRTSIYTYQNSGNIAGLISVEWHRSSCIIELLAVLQSYQGRGIGGQLIKHVKRASIMKGIQSVEVKTQLSNLNARALYCKNSFIEQDRSFLYHAHHLSE